MTRNGKIARLPRRLRQELNLRLADGEQNKLVVEWLNELPEVQKILNDDFGGRSISEQNMSEWKQGGYVEWQRQQESCDLARSLAERSEAISKQVGDVPLSDQLSGIAALSLGRMIQNASSGKLETSEERREVLAMIEALALLRRSDNKAERLQMEITRCDEERERNLRKSMEAEIRRKELNLSMIFFAR